MDLPKPWVGRVDFGLSGVSDPEELGWTGSVSVTSSVDASLEACVARVSPGASSFLDHFLNFVMRSVSLASQSCSPGGGDVEGLPSNEESSSGGRFLRGA